MAQIFGEFIEEFPPEHEALELSLLSSSQTRENRWRNNRLSAYFLADYFLNLMPINEKEDRLEEIKNTLRYIGNELLENAVKFNEYKQEYRIKFGIHLLEETEGITAIIYTQNYISLQKFEKFQELIQTILSADPNELYVQQIEKTAADGESEASGLGLLTAINDYSAKLGWKFEPDSHQPQIMAVTTMAQIVV